MAKLNNKTIIGISVVVVIVAVVAGMIWYNNTQAQKRIDAVKREASLILSSYKSKVIYNSLKVPGDSEITGMVPMAGVETITSIKTSGEPSTDTAVLKTAEKCDGSTNKTGAAVRILLPDETEYCVD